MGKEIGILKPKQRRFVEEYLVDNNGAQAAIRAGYAKKTARITASKLLSKPNIRAAVEAGLERARQRCEVTRDSLAEELAEDREFAREVEQAGAAVSASIARGKLFGLFPSEKVQVSGSVAIENLVNASLDGKKDNKK